MKQFKYSQLGVTLIDALIAMVVAGVGLLALAFFQADLVTTSSESKARTKAIHIAQEKIEQLRNLAIYNDFIKEPSFGTYTEGTVLNTTSSGNDLIPGVGDNTTYNLSWTVSPIPSTLNDEQYAKVEVTVLWETAEKDVKDLDGDGDVSEPIEQDVVLSSFIAWNDPQRTVDEINNPSDTGGKILGPQGSGITDPVLIDDEEDDDITSVSNNDGSTSRYDSDSEKGQIIVGSGDDTVAKLQSSVGFIRLRGNVIYESGDVSLLLTSVIATPGGFCQFNPLEYLQTTLTGNLDMGDFSCYVSSDWAGNLWILASDDSDINCSATIRFSSNSDITNSEAYLTEGQDPVLGVNYSNSSQGIVGTLTEQNFFLRTLGCSSDALGQVTISGSVSVSAGGEKKAENVTIDGGSCTLTYSGQTINGYTCTVIAGASPTIEVTVEKNGTVYNCTGDELSLTDVQTTLTEQNFNITSCP